MQNAAQQFTNAAQANAESLQTIANTLISSAQRLGALNLSAAKTVIDVPASDWSTVLASGDPQHLTALSAAPRAAAEKAIDYSRNVYAILSETGAALFKAFEHQVSEAQKGLALAIDQATAHAPAGTEVTFAAVKSALETATLAYDNVSKAAKQAAEAAHASIATAADAGLKAVATLAPATATARRTAA